MYVTHRRMSEYLDVISAAIEENRDKGVHYADDAVLAETRYTLFCGGASLCQLLEEPISNPNSRSCGLRYCFNMTPDGKPYVRSFYEQRYTTNKVEGAETVIALICTLIADVLHPRRRQTHYSQTQGTHSVEIIRVKSYTRVTKGTYLFINVTWNEPVQCSFHNSARIGLRAISSSENALRPGFWTSQLSIQGSD